MNDMNDPAEWNIRPGPHEGHDGKKWNYMLLVPMLGIAFYRWVWKRDSQREIQELNIKYTRALKENQNLKQLQNKFEEQKRHALDVLNEEETRQERAQNLLKEVKDQLMERQKEYCSYVLRKGHRLELEKELLLKANNPVWKDLGLEEDFKDIFECDKHCAELLNLDRSKNGKLMWLYLKYWNKQVELRKFKKSEDSLISLLSNVKWQ